MKESGAIVITVGLALVVYAAGLFVLLNLH